MAHLASGKILKRVPFLRVSINASNNLQMYVDGRIVKCGPEGLRVLEIFAEPQTVDDAIKKLTASGKAGEDFRFAATIMHFYENGVLRDVATLAECSQDAAEERADDTDEVYFHCPLDSEELQQLIPSSRVEKFPRMTDARVDELVVNGRIYAQMSDELPADLGNRLAHCDRFLQQYPILWVEDPATNVLSPYWLTSEQKDLVEQLKSVALRPSELSAELLQTFAQANILLRKDFEESRCEDWSRKFEALRRELETKQYAVLRDIIPPLQLAALRKYVRALDRKMYLELEERTIAENRYSIHNDETARFIHHQLTRLVNRIIPDQVIPSFTFLSVHKPGAQLHRHTDRPQCAWNLSLLIDTEPEAGLADAWPFYLEIEGRSEKVQLEMGDAVLYSGKRTPHWRNALPAGQQVALIFCCFVPVSFRGFLT